MTFSIDPYTYQLTVSGNADRDTLSQIEKLLNEGDNAKIFGRMRGFVCMIQTMKLLIRKQIGQRQTNILYGMKCMRQQGMMHAMRHIEMVLLLQRMAQIYLPCLRQRLKMAQGMNFILIDGWNMLRMAGKRENDLVLKIGFDSSGLYDIGQERGYGATQNMWMKGISQSIFEASV